MIDFDQTLIESTKAHRRRLGAAFVHGESQRRRPVNNNVRRLTGSVILGAVVCAGCLGTSFVLNLLSDQKESAAIAAYQQAVAANPLEPGDDLVEVEGSGFLLDVETGEYLDPRTGYVVDPETGWATDPQGRLIDTRTGWFVDPDTGLLTDPKSGITIDPETREVVDVTEGETP